MNTWTKLRNPNTSYESFESNLGVVEIWNAIYVLRII